MTKPSMAVLINTYNWPRALRAQLLALNKNRRLPNEVIVVDDGSKKDTKQMIEEITPLLKFPLHYLWQEDTGFRVAEARNRGIQLAKSDYLLFLDHDYIPRRDFIQKHRQLAQAKHFVSGSRILLAKQLSQAILNDELDISDKNFFWFLKQRWNKQCNRCLPLLRLPLGNTLRGMRRHSWKSTRNLIAVWRDDLLAVNGYDHSFQGWGYEDSDLVIRLLRSGIKRKLGKFATEVMHLDHPLASRDDEQTNYHRLMESKNGQRPIRAELGINALE